MSDEARATTSTTNRGLEAGLPMRAALLTTAHELEAAATLWYEVFVVEQQWRFGADNPVGLRTASAADGRSKLCDVYDDVSTCFGVWRGDVLVAAHRLTPPRPAGGGLAPGSAFHLERYLERLHLKLPERFKTGRTAEMTRLAVAPSARKTRALFLLLRREFEWLRAHDYLHCFTTSQFPQPGQLYVDLGMSREPLPEFRFEAHDPLPVSLLSAEPPKAHEARLWAMTEPMRERAA